MIREADPDGEAVGECSTCGGQFRVEHENDDMPDYVRCDNCGTHGFEDHVTMEGSA